ncbi:hypothetical protein ZYGR_0H04300 [Zygosaccharomyces rouxii]|uniref:ZYRO0B13882p n=2 Tax=Zygosaccharomyces rouxii TaxID=4956 RepID=C5DS51_ZYGRC|nr:uncharacterized protein ZYRO0B13882g [Zygosaccharomyces rouxii]KAH9199859.1 hypothetical protein LQ764DRAFT_109251 [Zygosaccharomyces rouxii]GAV47584.1 hypothetical protein ZYGR_0H04300 [Zygosaccharomyces rouxii]CAR26612.1 ZYRO0B13882p [Zygosaccharomyces rouxii]
MALENILRQHAEIVDFLKSLVMVHRRALQDDNLSSQLDGVRRDIYICFNDLCKLNDMLIACDGEIKETVGMLKSSKEKFGKLADKEIKLQDEKKKWSLEFSPLPESKVSIPISSSYRPLLNQYIELVGATNTSLAAEPTTERDEENGFVDRRRLLQSAELLQACHEESIKDIKQLESLLRDFKKDQAFIITELRSNQARIRRETIRIDESIDKIHQSRKKLLNKVGLAIPEAPEFSFLSHRLFNLQLNEDNKKREQEQQDIANHASEFIDMKIRSLQDQLTHKKEDSSNLITQRNLWGECAQLVKELEDRLSTALTSKDGLPSGQIKNWLKKTIADLNTTIAATDSDILITLITDEKEVIEKALVEISGETAQPLNIPKKNRYQASPSHSHSSPPFLVASKSPPKIGITDKTVDPATDANDIELENMEFAKGKSDKRD